MNKGRPFIWRAGACEFDGAPLTVSIFHVSSAMTNTTTDTTDAKIKAMQEAALCAIQNFREVIQTGLDARVGVSRKECMRVLRELAFKDVPEDAPYHAVCALVAATMKDVFGDCAGLQISIPKETSDIVGAAARAQLLPKASDGSGRFCIGHLFWDSDCPTFLDVENVNEYVVFKKFWKEAEEYRIAQTAPR
jgi:hypothetical protein